jgi:hypothetical protein
MNIPESDARYYNEALRRGCALLLVKARNRAEAERARQVLNRTGSAEETPPTVPAADADYVSSSGPLDIEAVHLRGTSRADALGISLNGARIFDAAADDSAGAAGRFDEFEAHWRRGFVASFQQLGYRYEQFRPAYRYGHVLADDVQNDGRAWTDIESAVREDWEHRNPHTWEQVREAIRYAWEEARSRQAMSR